jgi:hypothetical protein
MWIGIPILSNAQTSLYPSTQTSTVSPTLLGPSVDMLVNPTTPRPGATVTVSLQSYDTDLLRAGIIWYQDGGLVKSSVGNTKITIQAKKSLGASTVIKADITSSEGINIIKEATITSQDLDLIAEPSGYTPPFYKGSALYVPQGVVIITALPQIVDSNGVRVSTKDIVYVWKKSDRVISDSSGLGRDRISISGPIPIRPIQIKLEASTKDGSIKLTRSINIESRNPTVLLYENNPSYGILFNKALTDEKTLTQEEINLFAAPYSMSTLMANSLVLTYEWYMNNKQIENPAGQNFIILRNEGKEGTATISVNVKNRGRIFQSAKGGLTINFGKVIDQEPINNISTF